MHLIFKWSIFGNTLYNVNISLFLKRSLKISGITVISYTNELEGETMDTYIEIHKPATEKNEYFLVLDEHDNFENDNILNLFIKN